jgi:hypothetical protein
MVAGCARRRSASELERYGASDPPASNNDATLRVIFSKNPDAFLRPVEAGRKMRLAVVFLLLALVAARKTPVKHLRAVQSFTLLTRLQGNPAWKARQAACSAGKCKGLEEVRVRRAASVPDASEPADGPELPSPMHLGGVLAEILW